QDLEGQKGMHHHDEDGPFAVEQLQGDVDDAEPQQRLVDQAAAAQDHEPAEDVDDEAQGQRQDDEDHPPAAPSAPHAGQRVTHGKANHQRSGGHDDAVEDGLRQNLEIERIAEELEVMAERPAPGTLEGLVGRIERNAQQDEERDEEEEKHQ